MIEKDLKRVPVADHEGRLVGMLVRIDVLKAMLHHAPDRLENALALLTERRLKRLPVLTADGTLLGVLSRDAVVRAGLTGGQAQPSEPCAPWREVPVGDTGFEPVTSAV